MRRLISHWLLLSLAPFGAESYQWPSKNWPTAHLQNMGVESREFEQFLSYAFPENLDWNSREGVRTQSLLVIKDGVLIYEKYRQGFGPEKRHHTWSVSKLLANTFMGIAERDKILSRQSRVAEFVPVGDDPSFQKMTIRDLLFWSSGFGWNESYEGNPLRSSVLEMLYGQQIKDVGDFVARTPLAHLPGKRESYSSGDTNLLSLTLRRALRNDDRYWSFPWKELFDPLGIQSAVIERDESGTFLLSSYAHMTPRDLAKIGLLYLNDGVWNKKKILPAGWIYDSTQLSPAFRGRVKGSHSDKPVRGMHLWTNKEDPRLNLRRPFPDVPSDMFAALGHWGQSMVMIPSERLIVVRMADDRDDSFDMNRFLKLLLQSFSSAHLGASRK